MMKKAGLRTESNISLRLRRYPGQDIHAHDAMSTHLYTKGQGWGESLETTGETEGTVLSQIIEGMLKLKICLRSAAPVCRLFA